MAQPSDEGQSGPASGEPFAPDNQAGARKSDGRGFKHRCLGRFPLAARSNGAEKKGTWQPKHAPDWKQVTADNLTARRQARPYPGSAEERERAVPEARAMAQQAHQRYLERQNIGGSSGSVAEGDIEMVDAAALMTSQREFYRTGEGVLPTSFEPQRHTFYVCGRPVQAPCLRPQFCSLNLCIHMRTQSSEPFALLIFGMLIVLELLFQCPFFLLACAGWNQAHIGYGVYDAVRCARVCR